MTLACWTCGAAAPAIPGAPSAYHRCCECRLVFTEATLDAIPDAYGEAYFTEYKGGDYLATEAIRRHESRTRVSWMARPPGRLLDIGAAAGFFLAEASAKGWSVTGIEPNEGLAQGARERFGLAVTTGFVEDVTLEDASLDAVTAWHTLEHIPRPVPTLARLRRALRPGGALFVEVPNFDSRVAQRRGWDWAPLEPDVHVAQYGAGSLRATLCAAGFQHVRTETIPFVAYVAGARRRLPRRVLLALRQRAWLRDPHPTGHELLRAVAR